VILRQAFVRMIPPLGNEFIALIKNSALVSLLTINDLMHEGEKIISVSYRSLEVWLCNFFSVKAFRRLHRDAEFKIAC